MNKEFNLKLWQILGAVISLTFAITAFAYQSDRDNIKQDIKTNEQYIIKLKEESATIDYVDKQIRQHKEEELRRYSDIKKEISETKEMVRFLYERELKKADS